MNEKVMFSFCFQCADEFLCWGANKSGESVLVRLARHPDGAIEAVLRVADASGHTMLLPKTVFADGSRQEAHRFSAGRLHATCLRPMRKWRLTYNGRLRQVNSRVSGTVGKNLQKFRFRKVRPFSNGTKKFEGSL